jgi:hypothetical protein
MPSCSYFRIRTIAQQAFPLPVAIRENRYLGFVSDAWWLLVAHAGMSGHN